MTELTPQEQIHVRTALRYLRTRCGGWILLAKAIRSKSPTIKNIAYGRPPGASLAFRLARLAGVPVDDVLTGKYPAPDACPHCGHRPSDGPTNDLAR